MQQHVVPTSAVDEHAEDIREWTAAGLKPDVIFVLLETVHAPLLLCKRGKKKVSTTIPESTV